jgi:hypothetical protein
MIFPELVQVSTFNSCDYNNKQHTKKSHSHPFLFSRMISSKAVRYSTAISSARFNSCRLFWEPTDRSVTKTPIYASDARIVPALYGICSAVPIHVVEDQSSLLRYWILNKIYIYRCGHIPYLLPAIPNRI